MPATGPRAPARTLVAVRAMVPVTQKPPNSAEPILANALRDQFAIGAMPAAGHAVGDDRREQRFDAAEQRERERVGQHRLRLRRAKTRQCRQRQRSRDAAEARADGLDRQRAAPAASAATTTAIRMPGQCGRSAGARR